MSDKLEIFNPYTGEKIKEITPGKMWSPCPSETGGTCNHPSHNKPFCFGHYLEKQCEVNGGHHNCPVSGYKSFDEENNCRLTTNQNTGMCNCEYKRFCHTMRQLCFVKYVCKPKEQCDFYQDFKEYGLVPK